MNKVIIEAELDTKQFDAQIELLEKELKSVEDRLANPKKYNLSHEGDIQELTLRAEKLNNKLIDLKKKREELLNPPTEPSTWASDLGKSLEMNIKKIGRLILGIFGIRGAYMAVRNAMSVITSEDEQLKADIDYMKNTLAYMLEPVVRRIVDLMKQLMFYVGYIAKAWFGVDIYAKASQKALASGAKSAKEMRKQLAGFDEMNVLQDSSGGEGAGGVAPSFDLGNIQDMPIPGWLEWLGENGEDLIPVLFGIAGGLVAMQLGFEPLQSLGIGITLMGIVGMLETGLDYITDPSWENFGKFIEYLGITLIGLGILFGNLPAILVGVGIAIFGIITSNWDKISTFVTGKILKVNEKLELIQQKFGGTIGEIASLVQSTIARIWNAIDSFFVGTRMQFDGFILFFKGVFTKDWDTALKGLTLTFQGTLQKISGIWDLVWGIMKDNVIKIGKIIANTVADSIKSAINAVIWYIEQRINSAIDMINSAITLINLLPGVKVGKINRLNLPRLAKGGIINQPGRGVMVGNAIAGERGAEGVIPLTDSQQMSLLGEAIGRYVTINATIPVYAYNRQVDRQMKKIKAEDDFAYNR